MFECLKVREEALAAFRVRGAYNVKDQHKITRKGAFEGVQR